MKILIMGLPGTGKTSLARALHKALPSVWYNADDVRSQYGDWDFTPEGRLRQAARMRQLAEASESVGNGCIICDFVAPTQETRDVFGADCLIWVDRVDTSEYADTNVVFQPPTKFDIRISAGQTIEQEVQFVLKSILTMRSDPK